MQCSNCGNENSSRVKFCSECGSPIGSPCPYCAYRNARDAAACGACGRSLSAAQTPQAERRQLTVFFADIAGSTALAEALDPEDLRELFARYQNICQEVVARYEGHVAQYLGDGVLAYFGYPAAHEDDAARAVRSGLEILAQTGSIGVDAGRPQLRIGVHTGLVVVGEVGGGLRREQLALGEAPNVAARLQSEALPDTIVISGETRKLLAGQFALEDLGSRTLKGFSRPMQIFRVLGRSNAASRFHARAAVSGLTTFVGRERETEIIRAAWSKAAESRCGGTLLLRGEAGIGKSRLLEAAAQIAAGRLHEAFDAECSPYRMNSPLYPIIEMIERRMGIAENMPAANKLDLLEQFAAGRGLRVEEATPALAALIPVPTLERYPEVEMPPAKRLQWTIGVLAESLLHAVGGSPVLLLIEDLHWADPSTLDLLDQIVARQTDLPVLMVCTARSEFTAAWLNRPNCQEIRVESLPPGDTRELVARVAGGKSLPLALQEELVARTGGIPLFVEAVTRTVMEAGILRELDDRYELTGPLPPGLIPATVQDSLMGRIDRLGTDRPVAQLAATIGRESSFELLQSVLGNSTESLTKALTHLVELDLVSEDSSPPLSTYTFKHALIQDAAYESLLRKTRQEFHARIAEVLTNRFPDMAQTKPELLARHFEGAGRTAEAITGWMSAGQQAQQRLALRECAAYLRKAVGLLETLPEDDPGRLQSEMGAQLALGQALTATLGWASRELEASCVRARDLCTKLGNSAGLLQALNGLSGMYFLRGSHRQAVEVAQSVLDIALANADPVLQIEARHAISYPTYFMGDFIATREHAEKALAVYTPERERAVVTTYHVPSSFACAHILALSLWFLGYPEQAEREHRRAWAIVEALNISACTAFALGCTLDYHYVRRDRATIERMAEEAYQLSNDEGYLFWAAQTRIFRGWAHALDGHAEAGIAEMKAGMESYRITGSGILKPEFCLMMAEAHMSADHLDEALEAVCSGLRHTLENAERVQEPELHRLKGEIHWMQGDGTAAEGSLRRAIEVARSQKAKMPELRAALALTRVLRGQSRMTEARSLLQPLDEWFQEGRELPELREARALVESLGRQPLRTPGATQG
jgi:class 3 adenylate cyclase/tetratricopeptide (TPR) repeat protein